MTTDDGSLDVNHLLFSTVASVVSRLAACAWINASERIFALRKRASIITKRPMPKMPDSMLPMEKSGIVVHVNVTCEILE